MLTGAAGHFKTLATLVTFVYFLGSGGGVAGERPEVMIVFYFQSNG